MEREIAWMKELSIRTGRPVTFGFVQNRSDPDGWRYWLELVGRGQRRGRRHPAPDDDPGHRRAVRPGQPHALRQLQPRLAVAART